MKKSTNFLLLLMLAFLLPTMTTAQNINQGFETNSCSNISQPFFTGCFTNWQSVSGTADIKSNFSGITPYSGSRYVHMYSKYRGFYCSSSPKRGESIAVNHNFQAGQTYTIKYKLAWTNNTSYCHSLQTKFVLTNNRSNQQGGSNGCASGEILPTISSTDQVVQTHNMLGNQTSWNSYTYTFTPSSNYNQLWIRPETSVSGECSFYSEAVTNVFLDAFEIQGCDNSGLTTDFYLWASSNQSQQVTAYTYAYSNPVFVYHWWDVYYAPNGSVASPSTQVPGNPTSCCTSNTSVFNNNLYTNQWYYIKHGIWNQCTGWRETRKRFRVQIGGRPQGGGEPEYVIEMEDVDFEPTKEYAASMEKMMSEISPKELKSHNENTLETIGDLSLNELMSNPNSMINSSSTSTSIKNYPNPFRATTTIEFNLEKEQPVSLRVYDLTGKLIDVLLEKETRLNGKNQVLFDGSNLSEGVYFYTIETDEFRETKKMILMK